MHVVIFNWVKNIKIIILKKYLKLCKTNRLKNTGVFWNNQYFTINGLLCILCSMLVLFINIFQIALLPFYYII